MARIYISSSWRNGIQPSLVKELRKRGHQVYDFRHPFGRRDHNVWESVVERLSLSSPYKSAELTPADFGRMLGDKIAKKRFLDHYHALSDADTCILLLPSGSSSHVEAGFMAGAGKRVFVMDCNTHTRPELMYLTFDGYFHDFDSLYAAVDEPIPGVCRVCGCTEDNPCFHPIHGYCSWVEPSLCSHCATLEEGGYGIKDDICTEHCVNDQGKAFKTK